MNAPNFPHYQWGLLPTSNWGFPSIGHNPMAQQASAIEGDTDIKVGSFSYPNGRSLQGRYSNSPQKIYICLKKCKNPNLALGNGANTVSFLKHLRNLLWAVTVIPVTLKGLCIFPFLHSAASEVPRKTLLIL